MGAKPLAEGMSGEEVEELQRFLHMEGYFDGPRHGFTGFFGPLTRQALRQWQADNGVQPTGNFGASSLQTFLAQLDAQAEATQQAREAERRFRDLGGGGRSGRASGRAPKRVERAGGRDFLPKGEGGKAAAAAGLQPAVDWPTPAVLGVTAGLLGAIAWQALTMYRDRAQLSSLRREHDAIKGQVLSKRWQRALDRDRPPEEEEEAQAEGGDAGPDGAPPQTQNGHAEGGGAAAGGGPPSPPSPGESKWGFSGPRIVN